MNKYFSKEKEEYFKKYIEPNETALEQYAIEIGLKSDSRRFLLSEAYSRKAGEEVLWDIDSSVETVQKPLKFRYDILNYSGKTAIPVEVKCRGNSIDKYPTTDITANKGDFIAAAGGWLIVFFNEGFDYLVFDLTRYTPEQAEWVHSVTTAEVTERKKEEKKYCFDPSEAIYKGRLNKHWVTDGGYGRH